MAGVVLLEDNELFMMYMQDALYGSTVTTYPCINSSEFREFLQSGTSASVFVLDDKVPNIQGRITPLFRDHHRHVSRKFPHATVFYAGGSPDAETQKFLEEKGIARARKDLGDVIEQILTLAGE